MRFTKKDVYQIADRLTQRGILGDYSVNRPGDGVYRYEFKLKNGRMLSAYGSREAWMVLMAVSAATFAPWNDYQ